jgi:hypothetical protein
MLGPVKQLLFPPGLAPRAIQTGPFRGLKMELDLQGQTQLYLGLWEREVYPWLDRLSRGIRTAVDIGSAEGEYLLYFLKRTNATRVFAFEPDPDCEPALRRNLELNGMDRASSRLTLSNEYVGRCPGPQMTSLDEIAGKVEGPCMVKMDVDGQETAILAGARSFLELGDVRWLIETHSVELERDCQAIFQEAGYQTQIIPNAWWRVIVPEHRPGGQNRWMAATRRVH